MNMCVPELKSSVSFCQALSSLNEFDYLTHYICVHGSLLGYDTHKCLYACVALEGFRSVMLTERICVQLIVY